jgi:hypothetical protein
MELVQRKYDETEEALIKRTEENYEIQNKFA